jgi:hypothetical protein
VRTACGASWASPAMPARMPSSTDGGGSTGRRTGPGC